MYEIVIKEKCNQKNRKKFSTLTMMINEKLTKSRKIRKNVDEDMKH